MTSAAKCNTKFPDIINNTIFYLINSPGESRGRSKKGGSNGKFHDVKIIDGLDSKKSESCKRYLFDILRRRLSSCRRMESKYVLLWLAIVAMWWASFVYLAVMMAAAAVGWGVVMG